MIASYPVDHMLMSRYPLFVLTWWITGTMAIACYTAAFVWTMEVAAGKWKIYLGMSMNYSWPVCRLIIAGVRELYQHRIQQFSINRFGILAERLALASPLYFCSGGCWSSYSVLAARISTLARGKVVMAFVNIV